MDVFFFPWFVTTMFMGKIRTRYWTIDILRIFVLSMIMNHLFVVFIVTDSFIGLLFHKNI